MIISLLSMTHLLSMRVQEPCISGMLNALTGISEAQCLTHRTTKDTPNSQHRSAGPMVRERAYMRSMSSQLSDSEDRYWNVLCSSTCEYSSFKYPTNGTHTEAECVCSSGAP